MKYKLPKEIKERMERELRQYEHNKKKFEKLKQNEENTRRLLYIEEKLECVETVFKQLRPEEQEIYSMIFKNGFNWLYCQTMYNIDKTTYYNVYNKSLFLLAQEWGEI